MSRLKWSHRRKRHRSEETLRDVHVSLNTGRVYWISSRYDPARKSGRWLRGKFVRTYWWRLWTVHIGGENIGTWSTLTEAKYEAQLHHEMLTFFLSLLSVFLFVVFVEGVHEEHEYDRRVAWWCLLFMLVTIFVIMALANAFTFINVSITYPYAVKHD